MFFSKVFLLKVFVRSSSCQNLHVFLFGGVQMNPNFGEHSAASLEIRMVGMVLATAFVTLGFRVFITRSLYFFELGGLCGHGRGFCGLCCLFVWEKWQFFSICTILDLRIKCDYIRSMKSAQWLNVI